MQFLMTWHPANNAASNTPPPAEMMTAMDGLVGRLTQSGEMVMTGGMLPITSGARINLAGGKVSLTDGPFIETKELIGGYCIVNVKSKKEALEMATEFVELHAQFGYEGEAEVRQLLGPDDFVNGEVMDQGTECITA